MQIDERALAVLNRLKSHGYEVFLVGGCVRDYLRGVAAHDYDATTSALPEETLKVFPDCPVVETGRKHGTVTVLWDGLPVEVTTYRVDGDYADGRHPDAVTFTRSLKEDLARRDFTVNAIAWSPDTGIVDPFGGADDLKQGVLRCVGDPERRFTEDALRILRGLRFSSVLGFPLEEASGKAAFALRDRLKLVSAERIREEFVKLLCGENVLSVLMEYWQILGVFLPEILPAVGFDQHNFHHVHDVYTHLAHATAAVPPVETLRVAAFFHDIAKPACYSADETGTGHFYGHAPRSAEMTNEILRRLRFDNDTRTAVVTLIRHHDAPIEPTPAALRRKLNKLGAEGFFDLIALMRADNRAQAPEYRYRQAIYDTLEALAEEILAEKQCFSLKDLAVDGHDLQDLGYRGREIGERLKFLLEAVMDGRVENEKTALLSLLSKK